MKLVGEGLTSTFVKKTTPDCSCLWSIAPKLQIPHVPFLLGLPPLIYLKRRFERFIILFQGSNSPELFKAAVLLRCTKSFTTTVPQLVLYHERGSCTVYKAGILVAHHVFLRLSLPLKMIDARFFAQLISSFLEFAPYRACRLSYCFYTAEKLEKRCTASAYTKSTTSHLRPSPSSFFTLRTLCSIVCYLSLSAFYTLDSLCTFETPHGPNPQKTFVHSQGISFSIGA